MKWHPISLALAVLLLTAEACSSASNEKSTGSASTAAQLAGPVKKSAESPPKLISFVANLELGLGQCYARTSEIATAATPDPAASSPTNVAEPPTVAHVDCAGSNRGKVFFVGCLNPTGETDQLALTECPGDQEAEWPGDQENRRLAAQICLRKFSEAFGLPYSESPKFVTEFSPNRGLWDIGDRRLVCAAT